MWDPTTFTKNRNGLIVGAVATRASGHAERLAAVELITPHAEAPGRAEPVTLGADKGYDAQDFAAELGEIDVTPHVAQNLSGRRSAVDDETARDPGYAVSLRVRKAHRGGLRLGQDHRRAPQGPPPRAGEDRLAVHLRHGGL